jgi:hypothetical protein
VVRVIHAAWVQERRLGGKRVRVMGTVTYNIRRLGWIGTKRQIKHFVLTVRYIDYGSYNPKFGKT